MAEVRERHFGKIDSDSKGILFAIEDTGHAFTFYMTYLAKNYKIESADLVGVGGADKFNNELMVRTDYDGYIIIYDSGAEIRKLNSISRAIKNLRKKTNAPIYLFTPKCFEEILMSFTCLQNYVAENKNTDAYKVYRDIQKMMNGADCVDYFQYDSESIVSEEQKIEQYIEELTDKTIFEYKHTNKRHPAFMSDCWVQDCCQFDKTTDKYKHLKGKMDSCEGFDLQGTTKTKVIAENSLLGMLDNYLEKAIKHTNNKSLTNMNPKKKNELWGEYPC